MIKLLKADEYSNSKLTGTWANLIKPNSLKYNEYKIPLLRELTNFTKNKKLSDEHLFVNSERALESKKEEPINKNDASMKYVYKMLKPLTKQKIQAQKAKGGRNREIVMSLLLLLGY